MLGCAARACGLCISTSKSARRAHSRSHRTSSHRGDRLSKTRRKLVTMSALAAAGLSAARPTWPQAPARIKRIGWITNQPFATSDLPAVFFEAMRERGWVEGTHFVLDNRSLRRPCRAHPRPGGRAGAAPRGRDRGLRLAGGGPGDEGHVDDPDRLSHRRRPGRLGLRQQPGTAGRQRHRPGRPGRRPGRQVARSA